MEYNELMERDAAPLGEQERGRLSELAGNIRAAEGQNRQLAQLMLDNAVDIGRWLTEAKTMVPHGEWGKWLKENVDYSQSKAQNLMRLYQEYGIGQESLFRGPKSQALGNLSVTKALRLLAVPDGPEREEFLEKHDVAAMTSRELDAAIKERDDALRTAAQAQANQTAAEQARKKMEADMAMANERIAGLNAEVEMRSAEAGEARETAARLERELEELRSRPREVAVEADTATVEAARKEAEERMRAQLDAAKKARDEAEKARKAAEDARAEAQMEAEKANSMLEEARKKSAVATDPDLVLFSELLDQVQAMVNRMGGVRRKKKDKDPETAGKLQAALLAFSSMVKEVAQQ